MKEGDIVLVTAEGDDQGSLGMLRMQRELILLRPRRFWIVRFDDGHESAYEEWEMRVIVEAEQDDV